MNLLFWMRQRLKRLLTFSSLPFVVCKHLSIYFTVFFFLRPLLVSYVGIIKTQHIWLIQHIILFKLFIPTKVYIVGVSFLSKTLSDFFYIQKKIQFKYIIFELLVHDFLIDFSILIVIANLGQFSQFCK